MKKTKGVSLAELLLVILIEMLAIVISFQTFVSLSTDYRVVVSYLGSYLKGREIVDTVSMDCRMAVRVMDTYASYATADDCVVLKTPSIDISGNIVDVNQDFDYIVYYMHTGDLWKAVYPGPNSSRASSNRIVKSGIESLHLAADGTAFSSIPHKSVITHFTFWVSVSETILGRDYRVTPGTTVKLMNYEWEWVR